MTLLGACGGRMPAPRGASAVTVAAGPLPTGPAEPDRGLPMPSLDLDWAPPMQTAGDLESLRQALAGSTAISIRPGPRLRGPEWEARLQGLAHALAPQTTLAAGAGPTAAFSDRSLPLHRLDADVGRPRYAWDQGPLPGSTDGSAVLVIDDAAIDPARWRALPARTVGSCDAPMAALATGQEQSLAELEPFLDHADAVLWQVYRAALTATLPRLSSELEPYAALRSRTELDDEAAWEQYQCGHAYWEYLQGFAHCGAEADGCPMAPRVFLMGGARIGTAEPSVYVPEGCAAKVGRDYVVELRNVAAESAEVATEHLAPDWVALSDRLGALTEVYEALEDVCAPRRRRFTDEDLLALRQRLAAIGETLAADEHARPEGRWERVELPFHVPGLGPVQQVAEYAAGPGSASERAVAQARALRELGLRRALCRTGEPTLPLAVAVTDGRGEVGFFGYFFEEELICGDLWP
ncbi:MAG: hypothetical protein H6712_05395 [Myxococcales bacterium]|nr:hypothetical protein [Myxococcales bacterium]MCB9713268.1 hypothetical protein [Myxococcales bacterium]